jgi:hypothetical protein
MVDLVTPTSGLVYATTVAQQAVMVTAGRDSGGLITNPALASDQGLPGGANPEPLYIDPVGLCPVCAAGNTTFRLEPGQSWTFVAGQTTATWVNALTGGHAFSVVRYS